MSRGLSGLQKSILSLAAEYRAAGRTGRNGVDLYTHEILHDHFGWEYRAGRGASLKSRISPGGVKFERAAIGTAAYNATRASLSRALRRLAGRGLIELRSGALSSWTGLRLMAAGAAAAAISREADRPGRAG